MAMQEDNENEGKVYSNQSMMTQAQITAMEIIDALNEDDNITCYGFSFEIRMAVMVEAIKDLISLLEEDEEYERCAIFRDVLIELDNYEREG